jgi:hypothetical protein
MYRCSVAVVLFAVANGLAMPIAGVVAVAGAVTWGGYRVYKAMQKKKEHHQIALDFDSPTDGVTDCSDDCAARIAALFPEFGA